MIAPAYGDGSLLELLLSGEKFWPTEPANLHELGLSQSFLETLCARRLLTGGSATGRTLAADLCLPYRIVASLLERLKTRRHVTHEGAGQFGDYLYGLSEEGRKRADASSSESTYVGPAPVPLNDYIISVEAQSIRDEPVRRSQLMDAFHDISVQTSLLDLIGPAVNSGGGMFLYGAPGNGKSTLAQRITVCFGQEIWIPHAIIDGGQVITLFDPAYHHVTEPPSGAGSADARWIRIRRPTVVVGGELTLDSLELRYDPVTRVCEAPLQMKSNCGCLLIDDFGRQRVSPEALLNRWIVPLESMHDFLTLPNGKKMQIPFEQLILFSTNLEPSDLVDEAFLRRIPYRIKLCDPAEEEFHRLFEIAAGQAGCSYDAVAVEHLLSEWYRPTGRALRRCHARDILKQVNNYCTYNDIPFEMRADYFDRIAEGFFTEVETRRLSGRYSNLET